MSESVRAHGDRRVGAFVRAAATVALSAIPGWALANCGAAFCLVNTDWSVQGAWVEPGVRADLRYEAVRQSRLQAGSGRVDADTLLSDRERRTDTRRLLATVDWGITPHWGLSVSLPFIDREHLHTTFPQDEDVSWHYRQPGDARVLARYQPGGEHAAAGVAPAWGLIVGLKLPTGRTGVHNGNGVVAERTLQPGTGTTDVVLGAFWRQPLAAIPASWFAQVQVQSPVDERDGFAPGTSLGVDVGLRYQWTEALAPMVQLNLLARGRDSGAQADARDSGLRSVSLSPGIAWSLTRDTQLYGFLQIPIRQSVNGTQLVPAVALTIGLSTRF